MVVRGEVREKAARAGRRALLGAEERDAYLCLLPALVLLALFQYWPVVYNVYVSLHKWKVADEGYVGLANYGRALTDDQFWQALLQTAEYVVGTVPFELALGLIVALILFELRHGAWLYRLLFFMPYVTSQVAVAIVWRWVLNGNLGAANAFLVAVGLPPLKWLDEPGSIFTPIYAALGLQLPDWAGGPSLALVSVMIVTVWFYLGLHIVIYLAGLTAIPRDVLEAARIDGASGAQIIRRVIFPLLTPTTFFLLVIATIGAFQSFSLIYVLTTNGSSGIGEPLGTTLVATLYVFERFYQDLQLGYAAALALFVALIILAITVVQFVVVERRVHYE